MYAKDHIDLIGPVESNNLLTCIVVKIDMCCSFLTTGSTMWRHQPVSKFKCEQQGCWNGPRLPLPPQKSLSSFPKVLHPRLSAWQHQLSQGAGGAQLGGHTSSQSADCRSWIQPTFYLKKNPAAHYRRLGNAELICVIAAQFKAWWAAYMQVEEKGVFSRRISTLWIRITTFLFCLIQHVLKAK